MGRRPGAAWSARIALAGVLLGLAGSAEAQQKGWFLLMEGQAGPISALSGTLTTGLTDTTKALSYGQNLFVPIDAMGNPGALQVRPLRVVKGVDGSSPRIAAALANAESITTCALTLYEYGMGSPTPLYEILLGGARIIGVAGGGDAASAAFGPGTETVSILFQSVKLTDFASGQSQTIP